MDTTKIKVFLVDDHQLVAEGIRSMLSQSPDIQVCGWASSGEDAINAVETCMPDVVLMDIVLKNMSGLEATRWIKERRPSTKIIILSTEVKKEFLSTGIQCGINGYLHKDIEKETLVEAIRSVHVGREYFTEALTKLVFEDYFNNERVKNGAPAKSANELTKRENEVLGLIASGKTTRETAEALFVSVKTVETHKAHILDKLGLKNTAELTKYAIKNNIVTV